MARHDASVRQIKSPYGPPYPRHSHCVRPRAVTRSVCVLHRVLNSFSSSSSSSLAVPPSLFLSLSLFLGQRFRKSTGRFARTFCLSSRYRSTIYTLFELFGRCSPSLSLSFCFFPFLFLLVERIIKLAIPDGTWRDCGQTMIVFSYFLFFFSDLLSFEPFSICAPLNGKLFSANVGILN